MKRHLAENILEKDEQYAKLCKQGDIILIDDNYIIGYNISSKKNIFIRHYVEIKCPFCEKEIYQFISDGYDEDPESIKFTPDILINHMRKLHSDEFIAVKKSKIDLSNKICEITLTKKVLL